MDLKDFFDLSDFDNDFMAGAYMALIFFIIICGWLAITGFIAFIFWLCNTTPFLTVFAITNAVLISVVIVSIAAAVAIVKWAKKGDKE